LTISNLFPGETVVFPFDDLSEGVRRDLSGCFSSASLALKVNH
jgi:hypothetical protein